MTLSVIIAVMILTVLLADLETMGVCGDCGKRLVHAEDCWRRRRD